MAIALFAAAAVILAFADELYLRWQMRRYEKERQGVPAGAPGGEHDGGPEALPGDLDAESEAVDRRSRILAAVLEGPVAFALAMVSYDLYKNSPEYTLKLLCVFEMLVPAAILDRSFNKIPNQVILAGLGIFVGFFLYEFLAMGEPFTLLLREALFGLLLGGGTFAFCGIVSRSGIGAGDIKLFAVLGLMMTWRGVFNLIFFSVLLITAYGLFHLATKRIKKNAQIPMGPFVLTAMAVAILLGI